MPEPEDKSDIHPEMGRPLGTPTPETRPDGRPKGRPTVSVPGFRVRRVRRAAAVATLLTALGCDAAIVSPDGPGPDDEVAGSYDHGLAPGASARDFLAADDYDRLVVEIQWVGGLEPTPAGLGRLSSFLAARLNKPAGIDLRVAASALPVAARDTYSADDIRALEAAHRTDRTEGRTLAAYIVFVPGTYADAANVLGIAYNNTSMAIFAETIDDHTGDVLEPTRATVEGTVLSHEIGHVLGLVANGSAMQTEHQDEPHGHHCEDENCLMYYAVRTTDFISNLLGGAPELDADCLADLAANGGR